MHNKKIKNCMQLKKIVSQVKKKNKKIAFTNGCFDLLHVGHIEYLKSAKKMADILIVALNTDTSIRKIKGPARPIMKLKDRQRIIAALESVDYVTSFSESTPLSLIRKLKPDLIIKGADWKVKDIVGKNFVAAYGGRAVNVKYQKGYSTAGILEEISKRLGKTKDF